VVVVVVVEERGDGGIALYISRLQRIRSLLRGSEIVIQALGAQAG
jgi:hypothetical protein